MSKAKLRTELLSDPLGVGYSGMSDQECANSLNAQTRSKTVAISSAELLAWSGAGATETIKSRYERIEDAAADHVSLAVKGACKAAIKLIERDSTMLDLSLADREAMVDALVAGSVLTADEKAELVALGTESISRAQELGIGKVLPGYVMKARA